MKKRFVQHLFFLFFIAFGNSVDNQTLLSMMLPSGYPVFMSRC